MYFIINIIINLKMIFFLLSQIFLFSYQNKYTNNYGKIGKEIFKEDLLSYDKFINKSNFINYRERSVYNNVIKNNSKYKLYSSINMNDKINENEINKFPNSTVYLINKENFNFSKIKNNNNYSFKYYDDIENKINKKVFVSADKKNNNKYKDLIFYFLVLISIANFIFLFIFLYFYRKNRLKLEVNKIANSINISSMLGSWICLFIGNIPIIGVLYSIYKSYLIINIIYLLNGYKILYFRGINVKIKIMIILIVAVIESIITLFFLYIALFSEISIFLFCTKNIIEHLILFVIEITMFLNYFINLYKQYRLQRRIRRIIILSFKYKLIIYSKVFIFTFLYNLGIILINIIIIIIYKKNNDDNFYEYEDIEYSYYMNISLEIFFSILFSIMFFPIRNSFLFFVKCNINKFFLAEIKKNKEKKMQINKLSKNFLKKQYNKKEYPLILLEPYAKTNNIVNGSHIYIGEIKNN